MTREEALQILDTIPTIGEQVDALEMAIKALEQEPCEAVSRQAVMDALCDGCELFHKNGEQVCLSKCEGYHFLVTLPPVIPKPKTGWIPVSEKLPNDRNWYLGIFKEPDTGWINPLPFICDYVGRETKATTKECWILRGFTDRDERIDYYFNLECVAWMPLPEPDKAESEDKK